MTRELAERSHAGIVVRLVWDERLDRVLVRYRDERTGDSWSAGVPHHRALEAFRHPNAYDRDPIAVRG
jgi:hypothetical protein